MASTINSSTSNGIVITPDTSGEIELQANGVTKAKITSNGLQDANGNSITGGMYRNLIINGDMKIAQRGTSVSSITTSGYYTVDRFNFLVSAGTFTMTQDTDVPTGQGFSNSVKINTTTTSSITGSQSLRLRHPIEGQNLQHLKFGISSAKSITLSFWIKSNLTGDAVVRIVQFTSGLVSDQIGSVVTINSANTWEKKTITFSGNTNNIITNNNNTGLIVEVYFAAGPDITSGTLPSTWTTYALEDVASGQGIDLTTSTSNYINITGLQLEVGSGASDFEFLPYDVQLARCQRYYETMNMEWYAVGYANAFRGGKTPFQVTKRASPTGAVKSGTMQYSLLGIYTVSALSNTGLTIPTTIDGFRLNHTRQAGGTTPTNGNIYHQEQNVTFDFSAEL